MGAKARSNTAQIVFRGEVRLSPDLIISPQFWPKALKEENAILLLTTKLVADAEWVHKVYYTNARAKSGRISLGKYIRDLGYDPKSLRGKVYKVTVNPGSSIKIHFNRSISDGKAKIKTKNRSRRA